MPDHDPTNILAHCKIFIRFGSLVSKFNLLHLMLLNWQPNSFHWSFIISSKLCFCFLQSVFSSSFPFVSISFVFVFFSFVFVFFLFVSTFSFASFPFSLKRRSRLLPTNGDPINLLQKYQKIEDHS